MKLYKKASVKTHNFCSAARNSDDTEIPKDAKIIGLTEMS